MTILRDAVTGEAVSINNERQMLVLSESQSEVRHVSEEGDVTIISSGKIGSSATTAYRSVLFIKNTNTERDLHIGLVKLGSTVDGYWRWIKNPTSISNAGTAPTEQNFNFSSTSDTTLDTLSGSATSITDGGSIIVEDLGNFFGDMTGALILAANDSIAFEFALLSGTTAGTLTTNIQVWHG